MVNDQHLHTLMQLCRLTPKMSFIKNARNEVTDNKSELTKLQFIYK